MNEFNQEWTAEEQVQWFSRLKEQQDRHLQDLKERLNKLRQRKRIFNEMPEKLR